MREQKELKNTAISIWSNSPNVPSGYGVQAKLLLHNLVKNGAITQFISNFGQEWTSSTIEIEGKQVNHLPRGWGKYSDDFAPSEHLSFAKKYPDKQDLLISLFDSWTMQNPEWSDLNKIAAWTPVDHITIPELLYEPLSRENTIPIAMAPNGDRALTDAGIDHIYIPHSVNTQVYQPSTEYKKGKDFKTFYGIEKKFLVGMVAHNKASNSFHRKAFSENLMAFSYLHQNNPDTVLYLHTMPYSALGGWDLYRLLEHCKIPEDAVIIPDINDYRSGFSDYEMASIYTAMDVLLATSYGEGFGVPTIEAQACGTRVIGSNWTATPDLLSSDSWAVEGHLLWDNDAGAWWKSPDIGLIYEALKDAYQQERGVSIKSIEMAKSFEDKRVWNNYWNPLLKKILF